MELCSAGVSWLEVDGRRFPERWRRMQEGVQRYSVGDLDLSAESTPTTHPDAVEPLMDQLQRTSLCHDVEVEELGIIVRDGDAEAALRQIS